MYRQGIHRTCQVQSKHSSDKGTPLKPAQVVPACPHHLAFRAGLPRSLVAILDYEQVILHRLLVREGLGRLAA